MSAYVIFNVEIHYLARYQAFMQGLKSVRDPCSSARLVSVEGLA